MSRFFKKSSRNSSSPASDPTADLRVLAMQEDEDIVQEAAALTLQQQSQQPEQLREEALPSPPPERIDVGSGPFIPLNRTPGGHRPNAATRQMLAEVGHDAIKRATTLFYERAFEDPVLDQFIRDHNDPHGSRFADWIAEKFGDGTPWTHERATRKTCPFASHGYTFTTPHDRTSAHTAAWHSPKRLPGYFGRRFKIDDCRVWMRLHFWAMRDAGAFDHKQFENYYVKFIGHFVSVYERSAPAFARDSARWSESQANIDSYFANNRRMPDVTGISDNEALSQLPEDERWNDDWPYYD